MGTHTRSGIALVSIALCFGVALAQPVPLQSGSGANPPAAELFAASPAPGMGRYFTARTLGEQVVAGHHPMVQLYLMGVYDATQYAGRSCAMRGTTMPAQLERAFAVYLRAHPEDDQTLQPAADVAALAFAQQWPCASKPANYLPGRYMPPAEVDSQIDHGNRQVAQFYLVGAYDLAQDAHQSCAPPGSTSPAVLGKVYTDYVRAHPEQLQADVTAAVVAAAAFGDFWPCTAVAPSGPAAQPRSFQFYYDADPRGWRYDKQIDATTWLETAETGQQSHHKVVGQDTVGPCTGQVILKDDHSLESFIPNSRCTPQIFLFRFIQPDGSRSAWHSLGPMEKIAY